MPGLAVTAPPLLALAEFERQMATVLLPGLGWFVLAGQMDFVFVCLKRVPVVHQGWVLQRQVRLVCQMPELMLLLRRQMDLVEQRLVETVLDRKDLAVPLIEPPDQRETDYCSVQAVDQKVIDWPAAAGRMATDSNQPVLLAQTDSAQRQACQTHWTAGVAPERSPGQMRILELT